MANSSLHTALVESPIDTSTHCGSSEHGAALQFLGVVRGHEDGEPIAGIRYSAYAPMAEEVLRSLGDSAPEELGEHLAEIVHRIGFVPNGEPSLLLRVATKHSAPALSLLEWYLNEVKTRVPIWKQPLTTAP